MLLLLLLACAKRPAPAEERAPIAEGIATIRQFEAFIGLEPGMDEAAIRSVLGEPQSTDEGTDTFRYLLWCDGDVRVGLKKATERVGPIRVRDEAPACLARMGIEDPRLEFIGQPVDVLLERFGQPNRTNVGNYEYQLTESYLPQVTFICYDFHEDRCSEIYVHWSQTSP